MKLRNDKHKIPQFGRMSPVTAQAGHCLPGVHFYGKGPEGPDGKQS